MLDVNLKIANRKFAEKFHCNIIITSISRCVYDHWTENFFWDFYKLRSNVNTQYFESFPIFLLLQDVLEEYAERVKKRGAVVKIDPAHLRWTPFVPPAPTTSS